MAFPTTGILDNFNRADAGDLGPNWTGLPDTPLISGNKAVSIVNDPKHADWNPFTAVDAEAYMTVLPTDDPSYHWGFNERIWARKIDATNDYYVVYTSHNSSGAPYSYDNISLNLYRFEGAGPTLTLLGQMGLTSILGTSGYRVGIRVVGTSIKVYFANSLSGDMPEVISVTDSVITGVGHIGFSINSSLSTLGWVDNFGGGELSFPPNAPTNLVVTALSPTLNRLVWQDNSSDEDNFVIQRRMAAGSWADYQTVSANVETWDDTSAGGNFYYYQVRATNAEGDSAYSNIAPSPAPPISLIATPHSAYTNIIDLYWTDVSDNETGFRIERSPNGIDWALLNTTGANVETYRDNTCVADTTYHYRVAAIDPVFGLSNWSNVATVTTIGCPPETPGCSDPPVTALLGGPAIVMDCILSAAGVDGIAVEVEGLAYILNSRLTGDPDAVDLLVDANSIARVQANSIARRTLTGNAIMNPLQGDRSVWDITYQPARHARDIADALYRHHVPPGGAVGQVIIWDGTKWVASSPDALTGSALEPVTNGDSVCPEIVFAGGDVVMVRV